MAGKKRLFLVYDELKIRPFFHASHIGLAWDWEKDKRKQPVFLDAVFWVMARNFF
jgi:hypothetical protein